MRPSRFGSLIVVLMTASSVLVSGNAAVGQELMHPQCNNTLSEPRSSAQGSYGTMTNTCDVQHFKRMISACVQSWNGSNWACISGTYQKTYAEPQSSGQFQVNSGWACTQENVRIRGRFIAWDVNNDVAHDIGAQYSGIDGGECASSVGVSTMLPHMPLDPNLLDII